MIMQNVKDSDDLQKVAGVIRSIQISAEEKGAMMSGFLSKIGKKYVIPTAVSLSLLATATGCDVELVPEHASGTNIQVALDSYGNVMTNPVDGSVLTHVVEPEETELYQNFNINDMGVNFLDGFDLDKALSGVYIDLFKEYTYGWSYVGYNEDPEIKPFLEMKYGNSAQQIIEGHQKVVVFANNIMESKDKNFTWQFSMVGVPDTNFYFVINDSERVFAITMQDTRTGREYIVEGVIGDQILYTESFGFIRSEEGAEAIRAYSYTHDFSNVSSRILSMLIGAIDTADYIPITVNETEDPNTVYSWIYDGDSIDEIGRRETFSQHCLGFNVSGTIKNPQVNSLSFVSAGFLARVQDKDGNFIIIDVPPTEPLITATNFGAQPLRQPILDELARQDGADISPDSE